MQDPKNFAISAIDFANATRNHSHGQIEKTDAQGSEMETFSWKRH